jgi:hypothetical protein
VLLILSAASAATCAVTGMLYPGFVSAQGASEVGPFFVIAGWVGGLGLLAGGVWQFRAVPRARLIALVLLAATSASYVGANGVGLAFTGAAPGSNSLRPWHWTGAAIGGALYLVSLVEAYLAFRARDES